MAEDCKSVGALFSCPVQINEIAVRGGDPLALFGLPWNFAKQWRIDGLQVPAGIAERHLVTGLFDKRHEAECNEDWLQTN